jgi:ribosomal protein S18 acetylase RimI-like enzyme
MILVFTPLSEKDMESTRLLNHEYLDWLSDEGAVTCYLSQQNAREIVNQLPLGHEAPDGDLLLATLNDKPIGTVALKRLSDDTCEMKRLYVVPEARHMKVGRILVDEIIKRAKTLGYQTMRLDTLPHMSAAQKLYQNIGFKTIEKYNVSPVNDAIYMELSL